MSLLGRVSFGECRGHLVRAFAMKQGAMHCLCTHLQAYS